MQLRVNCSAAPDAGFLSEIALEIIAAPSTAKLSRRNLVFPPECPRGIVLRAGDGRTRYLDKDLAIRITKRQLTGRSLFVP